MNPFEKLIGASQSEAVLRYGHNDFQVAVQGEYVRCAVTGTRIEVDNLKYWSVELQEPYVSAQASFRRYLEHRGLTDRFKSSGGSGLPEKADASAKGGDGGARSNANRETPRPVRPALY